ncbi:MAG: hypothetical protein IKR18_10900 [Bacteroidaceae bacterium]|nr:hypothetical protein [Bacteroidaceae bacterium]
MAIECFFERAYQYERLGKSDSTQQIAERAARRFLMIGNKERAVSAMTATIIPLLEKGETEKVRTIIDDYKAYSGRVDSTGKVSHGREIFYYKQGLYYLKVNMFDSAEATFRRELSEGNDLNNQIAGRKGLQLLYEKKRIIDSIAKYSREGYCLSDSVYALSESQNIQSLQAMFDYTHHLYIAEQKINKEKSIKIRMERTFFVTFLLLIAISYLLIKKMKALTWIKAQHATITKKYNEETLKNIDLKCEKELQSSSIAKQIRVLSMSNPPQVATASDLKELEKLFEETAPSFHRQIIQITYRGKGLNYVEKNVCMLTKLNIPSAQISRLLGLADGYTSTLKTRLYKKITNNIGTAKEFDQLIMSVKEELYQK